MFQFLKNCCIILIQALVLLGLGAFLVYWLLQPSGKYL